MACGITSLGVNKLIWSELHFNRIMVIRNKGHNGHFVEHVKTCCLTRLKSLKGLFEFKKYTKKTKSNDKKINAWSLMGSVIFTPHEIQQLPMFQISLVSCKSKWKAFNIFVYFVPLTHWDLKKMPEFCWGYSQKPFLKETFSALIQNSLKFVSVENKFV